MAPRRTGSRSRQPLAVKPDGWPDDGLVSVETAEPFAVFWDGEQRTGTIEEVPLGTAMQWMRNGRVAYFWTIPIA